MAALLTVLALGLAGCGTDVETLSAPSRAASNSGLDVEATIDRETGIIVFPDQRFGLTDEEQIIVGAAAEYSLMDCIRAGGVSFTPVPPEWNPLYNISSYYGVWTVPVAEQYAFVSPMTTADMYFNGVMVNGEPVAEPTKPPGSDEGWRANDLGSDEAIPIVAACKAKAGPQRFDIMEMTPGPWQMEMNSAYDLAAQTQESKDVIDEYHECLVGKGIEPNPDSNLAVVGQDPKAINAEQIALALEVVDCKDQVKLVDRLAGQIAAFQAPIIDKYATDLVAYRSNLDVLVADARAVLASYGVSE